MVTMSLTNRDLQAIRALLDERLDERLPVVVQPMLDGLEQRLIAKINDLALDVGQFSLETTANFHDLEHRLGEKIEALNDKMTAVSETADINRMETAKIKCHLGLTSPPAA